MMSLSAFVIPVFLDTNGDANHMLRQWTRLYHYGHIYLPALCITTCGLYAYVALSKRASGKRQWTQYVLAALSTIAMVPFTWVAMTPTNDTLFRLEALGSIGIDTAEAELGYVRALVMKWAWLHVTRSFAPLIGAILGLYSLLQECNL
jgi:hypothetical protein